MIYNIDNKKSIKQLIYKVLISIGLLVMLGLVTYRTVHPISKYDDKAFNFEKLSDNEVLIENDKVAFTLNLEGAVLHNFYFKNKKTYGLFTNKSTNDVDNCFETLWMSNSETELPVRSTMWELDSMEMVDNHLVVVIHVIIDKKKFVKKITLDEYTVHIEDKFSRVNINNKLAPFREDILIYAGFSAAKTNQETMNFISYLNNKKKILRINNKTITKDTKQKISQHDGLFGIENNLFLAICALDPIQQGNIFLQQNANNEDINQIFCLSDALNSYNSTLYLLPKEKSILSKYGFQNLVDYGWLAPIAAALHYIFNRLIDHTNSVMIAIILIALLVILINTLFIYISEKEKYKMELHNEEKQLLEKKYTGRDLQTHTVLFYKRHDIKMVRMLIATILSSLWLFPLNKAFSLTFALKDTHFLWLKDLSLQDGYSVLNLYDLIKFNPNNIPFISYMAFDVLSILAASLMIVIAGKAMSSQQGGTHQPMLMKIIHYVFFSMLCKSLSSGFMICFILISLGNFAVSQFIKKLFEKSILKV